MAYGFIATASRRQAILAGALLAGLVACSGARAINMPFQRIIFDGPKITDTLTVTNDTDRDQVYVMGWQRYRMLEDGGALEQVADDARVAGVNWADGMISFDPPRLVIPRGASGKVRLTLAAPSGLAAGEYRAHAWVRTVSPENAPVTGNATGIQAQSAISVPVFVRRGALAAKVEVARARLAGGTADVTLRRTGDRSVYGDVAIVCIAGKKPFSVKKAYGIAIYTETTQKIVSLPVDIPRARRRDCRTMEARYLRAPEDGAPTGETPAAAPLLR